MKRRDFLKLVGVSMAAPLLLAEGAEKQLPAKNAREQYDWVNEEIDRIRKEVNQLGRKDLTIAMSKQLLAELRNRWIGCAANVERTGFQTIYFNSFPTYESEYLPIPTKDGKVIHAIVLEDIPKDKWGWVQLGPHPFVEQLEKDGRIVYG